MEEPLEDRVSRLEGELRSIQERNTRVESDKAWEMSWFRVASIVAITYFVALVVLIVIGNQNPVRNALIPAVGYFLSVQSIPFLKKLWAAHFDKNRRDRL